MVRTIAYLEDFAAE